MRVVRAPQCGGLCLLQEFDVDGVSLRELQAAMDASLLDSEVAARDGLVLFSGGAVGGGGVLASTLRGGGG